MSADRVILHSDLNAFYASVEMMLNPELRGKAVAVCGSTAERHGIVLARSEFAKKAGVITGMVNWEAKRRCPELIMVPPQFEQYLKYARAASEIYQRYTDRVEPFGLDECWLDLTASQGLLGSGMEIAGQICRTVREELGLTVSIGVSFNKIFAKLGSDMKKPDAITEIRREDFRQKVWPLPAGELCFVGAATRKKLAAYGVRTIGDIAGTKIEFLRRILGKHGGMLWTFANGLDNSMVMPMDYLSPVKSVGHGITCSADLENNEELWKVMLELAQDIGHRLRVHGLSARGVQIAVKDNKLIYKQYQARLDTPTQLPMELARKGRELFESNYTWSNLVRAVTIRAINLVPNNAPRQLSIFEDPLKREKAERLEDAVEGIRSRFGKQAIRHGILIRQTPYPAWCPSLP